MEKMPFISVFDTKKDERTPDDLAKINEKKETPTAQEFLEGINNTVNKLKGEGLEKDADIISRMTGNFFVYVEKLKKIKKEPQNENVKSLFALKDKEGKPIQLQMNIAKWVEGRTLKNGLTEKGEEIILRCFCDLKEDMTIQDYLRERIERHERLLDEKQRQENKDAVERQEKPVDIRTIQSRDYMFDPNRPNNYLITLPGKSMFGNIRVSKHDNDRGKVEKNVDYAFDEGLLNRYLRELEK